MQELNLKLSFLPIQTFKKIFYSLPVIFENIHILKATFTNEFTAKPTAREVKMRIKVKHC